MREQNEVECASPESHWGPADPENQPNRDEILGLKRLVVETWDRLGKDASPDTVLAELRERGFDLSREQVEQSCPPPAE